MISETADTYPQSRTVFVYIDSEDDIAILGVWRVTQSYDGDDCCYYHAQIRLRYDNGLNAHFWNMFLDHQLQVVAGTDFDVEFQHHKLHYRFRSAESNGNKILFTKYRDGGAGIFVMNADGTGVGQLTDNPVQQPTISDGDNDPVWSPDGNKIAFTRRSDSCCGSAIFVMNADGTGIQQLTDNDNRDRDPVWSPDGKKIAFDRHREDSIFVMNADGTGVQELIDTDTNWLHSPVWSPDGNRILFASDQDGDDEIFVINADGTGIQQLTDNDSRDGNPVWSPDGKKIAFDRGWGIFVMNADGTGVQQLTDPHRPKSHDQDSYPVWSPDGKKIAFEGLRGSTFAPWGPYGDTQIFVMNADGTGVQQLTDNEDSNHDPLWSPDGNKIAFDGLPAGRSEIFVMNADGSNVIALGQPGHLSSWGG
jgi:TolB protein